MRKQRQRTPNATLTTHKRLDTLTGEEAVLYLEQLMERLAVKQQRERAYLDRRATRKIHTPTDDAYEADQVLEDEIMAVLDALRKQARERGHNTQVTKGGEV
jgi:hypothetical protein